MKRILLVAFSLVAAAASAQNIPLWWTGTTGTNAATDRVKDTVIDSSFNVYRLASVSNGTNANFSVTKYNTLGTAVWTQVFDYSNFAGIPDVANAIALGPDGNLVITGGYAASATVTNMFVTKLSSATGVEIWRSIVAPISPGVKAMGYDVAVAPDGTVFTAHGRANGTYAERPQEGRFNGTTGVNDLLASFNGLGRMKTIAISDGFFYFGGELTDASAVGLVGRGAVNTTGATTLYYSGASGGAYEKITSITAKNGLLIYTGYQTTDAAGTTGADYHYGLLNFSTSTVTGGYYSPAVGATPSGRIYTSSVMNESGQVALGYTYKSGSDYFTGIQFATVAVTADPSTSFVFGNTYGHTGVSLGVAAVTEGNFASFSLSGTNIQAWAVSPTLGLLSANVIGSGVQDIDSTGLPSANWNHSNVSSRDRSVTIGGGSSSGAYVYGLSYLGGPDDAKRIKEDAKLEFNVLLNDSNKTGTGFGATKTAALVGNPSHGVASIASNGDLTYTPSAGWSGTDTITYNLIVDGTTVSTPTVTIVVLPVNDAPVANDDLLGVIKYTGTTVVSPLTNDTDPESPAADLKISSVADFVNCEVRKHSDRKRIYVKPLGAGPFSFTYIAADPSGVKSNSATVSGTYAP